MAVVTYDLWDCCCVTGTGTEICDCITQSPETNPANQSVADITNATCFCCDDETMNGPIECDAYSGGSWWWTSATMGGIGEAEGHRCLIWYDPDLDYYYYAGPNITVTCITDPEDENYGKHAISYEYYCASDCEGDFLGPYTDYLYECIPVNQDGQFIGGPYHLDFDYFSPWGCSCSVDLEFKVP